MGAEKWLQMDEALRLAHDIQMPFANISCLFLGDFSQIAPVRAFNLSSHTELFNGFEMIELTQGMRQKGDLKFQDALNHYAEGTLTQDDLNLLYSLEDTSDMDWRNYGHNLVAIYRDNAKVDKLNKGIMDLYFKDTKITYRARWNYNGTLPDRGPMEALYDFVVAPGARVMCLINLKVNQGKSITLLQCLQYCCSCILTFICYYKCFFNAF